jgi:hypothetical protein
LELPTEGPVDFDDDGLLQDLLLFDVYEVHNDVHVDLYGGEECVCGSVTFTFNKDEDREKALRQLERWYKDQSPVALLTFGDRITLLSEEALLRRILDPD